MTAKNHTTIATGTGLIGGLVMVASAIEQGGSALRFLGGVDQPMLVSAAFGAFCAGWLTSGLFGRGGVAGGALAAVGAVLATGIGAGLGAAVCLAYQCSWQSPVAGLALGPFYVADLILGSPQVFATWAGCFALLHHDARQMC